MKNQLTREFQLTLKQYINEQIPIKVIFGDLKSECAIIKGADIGINSDGQTELGFDLFLYKATPKTIFIQAPNIEIFIGEYKIIFSSWFLQYRLTYKSEIKAYRLNIPIAECELIKLGEEANEE